MRFMCGVCVCVCVCECEWMRVYACVSVCVSDLSLCGCVCLWVHVRAGVCVRGMRGVCEGVGGYVRVGVACAHAIGRGDVTEGLLFELLGRGAPAH